MRPRGPDGSGDWYSRDGRVGLAHRRLAIIDLSDRAAQPMCSRDGELVVTFNGEIYNYLALRRELEAQGRMFRTTSDTEVLLHLYALYGSAMLPKLRGMFAFALWDARRRSLLLARDPYGVKPLYYSTSGQTVRFASQVRALAASHAVAHCPDPAAQVGFYLWGSVPEPFTRYADVRALPAGHSLTITERGVEPPRAFFSVASAWCSRDVDSAPASLDEARERVQAALADSVAHHMVADVPVSAFLSGGLDSGALVALMREHSASDLQGITLGFSEFAGSTNDEVPCAERIAQHVGITHRVRLVTHAEFQADLPLILEAMDQPTIDGINTWFVSKAAAELGYKVAISGLGGDELFGGYRSFRDVPWLSRLLWCPSRIPGLGSRVRTASGPVLRAWPQLHPKLAGLVEFGGTLAGAYFLKRGLFMPWELGQLLPADLVREGLSRLGLFRLLEAQITPEPAAAFSVVATLEASQYMRNQLLRDTDWASMAHSLEVRVPLVDAALLADVAPLLAAHPSLRSKQVLATAARRGLPESAYRRPKTGFSTPVAGWLRASAALDAWRRVPALREDHCPWARRYAYAVASFGGLQGGALAAE